MANQDRVKVGTVGFDPLTWEESLHEFEKLFSSPGQHQIAKANAEFVVNAMRSKDVANILSNCSLVLADGAGVLWAADALSRRSFMSRFGFGLVSFVRGLAGRKQKSSRIPERVGGADHVLDECKIASGLSKKIFLLGASEESRKGARNYLYSHIPHVQIAGDAGSTSPFEDAGMLIDQINASGAEFLIACFGHPLQERWLAENLPKMPHVKVADGEGGTFDFWSGVQKRAPRSVQKTGFEGFYRVLRNPLKRVRKFWISYPVFIWKVLTSS